MSQTEEHSPGWSDPSLPLPRCFAHLQNWIVQSFGLPLQSNTAAQQWEVCPHFWTVTDYASCQSLFSFRVSSEEAKRQRSIVCKNELIRKHRGDSPWMNLLTSMSRLSSPVTIWILLNASSRASRDSSPESILLCSFSSDTGTNENTGTSELSGTTSVSITHCFKC